MDFDNFCSLFECHSILAEKQQTKQTNYSFLSLSAFLDTHPGWHYSRVKEILARNARVSINPLPPTPLPFRRPWVLTFDTLKNSVTLKIEKHVMLFIWCFEKLKTVRVIGSGILCGGLVATS